MKRTKTKTDEVRTDAAASPAVDLQEKFYPAMEISRLVESEGNREGDGVDTEMPDLVASVRSNGVIEPIIVRPQGASTFEIVCGHRRTRAATDAGMLTIPAICRSYTDAQVAEVQCIENEHRKDPNPMSQARHYARMIATGRTVKEIAARTGHDVRYVAGRLAMLKLIPEFQAACAARKLPALAAGFIARYGEKAQKHLLDDYDFRQVDLEEWHLKPAEMWHWKLQAAERPMAAAPFDLADAALLKGCGTCSGCPNRSCNQDGLFADDAAAADDLCLDGECYEAKLKQSLKNAENALQNAGTQYVKIAAVAKGTTLAWSEQGKATKAKALLPTQYEVITAKEAKKLPAEQVRTALVVIGEGVGQQVLVKITEESASTADGEADQPSGGGDAYDYRAEQAKRERESKIKEVADTLRYEAVPLIQPTPVQLDLAWRHFIASFITQDIYGKSPLVAMYGWDAKKAVAAAEKFIAAEPMNAVQLLILRHMLSVDWLSDADAKLAPSLGLDLKAIEKKARKQVAEDEKAAAKAAGDEKPKVGKKPAPIAEDTEDEDDKYADDE